MRKLVLVSAFLLSVSAPLFAEIKLPQASPAATASQAIGISEVKLTYHRPAVKGRAIWGDLVPYGEVWRLGANEATTLELSHAASIAGHEVAAGKYSLFAIPAAGEWTMILNQKADQWGAYFHKPEDDVLRFKVKPQPGQHAEWMTISMTPHDSRAVNVEIAWEKLRVPFRIEYDVDTMMWKQIDSEVAKAEAKDWETWHNAARYAWQTGERLDDALVWIDKAMAHESFWNYEMKGLILQKRGNVDEAIPLMRKAMDTARGKAPQAYIDGLQKTIDSWKKP